MLDLNNCVAIIVDHSYHEIVSNWIKTSEKCWKKNFQPAHERRWLLRLFLKKKSCRTIFLKVNNNNNNLFTCIARVTW